MTTERVERTKDAGTNHQPHASDIHDEAVENAISFTDKGDVPGVLDDEMDLDGPSASERAYGDILQYGTTSAGPQQQQKAPKQFTTLKGNKLDATTAAEAKVLKALRQSHLRIDPAWLLKAQTNVLKVGDATGAMNTETLRAINTREGRAVTTDEILNDAFLTKILNTGQSPMSVTDDGFESETANGKATMPADKAAQAVGYADYKSYASDMGPVSFLGVSLRQLQSDGRAHTYLAERLALAENFLRGLYADQVAKAASDPSAKLKGDDLVAHLAGWNKVGGASYETGETDRKAGRAHQHTMGLAIDIDPSANGWIWDTHHDSHPSMDKHLGMASRMFGGKAFTAGKIDYLSDNTSTEELHADVSKASGAFGSYLKWGKQWLAKYEADEKGTTPAIIADLQTRGVKEADEAMVKDMMWFAGWFNDASYRKGMSQLTTIKMPLLVALRDVAGLSWGGTEMGSKENGDFMHFDCRDTAFGNSVVDQKRSPTEMEEVAENKRLRQEAAEKAKAAKASKKK